MAARAESQEEKSADDEEKHSRRNSHSEAENLLSGESSAVVVTDKLSRHNTPIYFADYSNPDLKLMDACQYCKDSSSRITGAASAVEAFVLLLDLVSPDLQNLSFDD